MFTATDPQARQPLMRKHHVGSRRIATISHSAVVAPDTLPAESETKEIDWQHGLDTDVESSHDDLSGKLNVAEVLVDFASGTRGPGSESVHISLAAQLWLGCSLSAVGSIITYLYLQAQHVRQEIAPEESLPPRPGSITSSLQILCITSLSISYGAMISSMTIFVLPKEAEHFFPKQSSISLGVLELLGAVSLLSGPLAGQVSVTWTGDFFVCIALFL